MANAPPAMGGSEADDSPDSVQSGVAGSGGGSSSPRQSGSSAGVQRHAQAHGGPATHGEGEGSEAAGRVTSGRTQVVAARESASLLRTQLHVLQEDLVLVA